MKITAAMVKDNVVFFQYYRDGSLWYLLRWNDPADEPGVIKEFMFPVPIDDTGIAVFSRDDKAIFFMRWMNKWAKELSKESTE